MVIKLTARSENKLEEKQETGLKLPEELRFLQNSLSLPNVPLPASAAFLGARVPARLVKAGSRGERNPCGARSAQRVSGMGGRNVGSSSLWPLGGAWGRVTAGGRATKKTKLGRKAGLPNSNMCRTACLSPTVC